MSLFNRFILFAVIVLFAVSTNAQEPTVAELKAELEALKAEYAGRIQTLETKLEELQTRLIEVPEAPEPEVAAAAPTQTIPGALNPAISIVGNFVGRADDDAVFDDQGRQIDDKVNMRETELDFRVPVDPYADGVLIASIESEFPGEFDAGVEEGYVNIKKLPFYETSPLGLKFKVGRFRPMFGKSNVLHTHDLPTTFRSLVTEEFLGEEGYVQNGISTSFFIPTPWDEASSIDATFELLDGGDIAISPQSESRLSYLGHIRWFRSFANGHDIDLGWSSYFHPSNDDVGTANVNGVDFLYRWRPARMGQWKSYLLGVEWMFAPNTTVDAASSETPSGLTMFTQWQFDRRTYAGVRFDATDVVANPDLQRKSITPYISYYFSEFLRLRLNYEHRWSDLLDEDGRNSVFLELNWIFGSHPPEPFWVNK